MERQYYNTYNGLYELYSDVPLYNRITSPTRGLEMEVNEIIATLNRKIIQTIDNVDSQNSLRPDAKYFLLVNFHQMIVLPIAISHLFNEGQEKVPDHQISDLSEKIESDIRLIVRESSGNGEEISGHAIMATIDKLWRKLKTTKINVWG